MIKFLNYLQIFIFLGATANIGFAIALYHKEPIAAALIFIFSSILIIMMRMLDVLSKKR